jgi:hypothetical protein
VQGLESKGLSLPFGSLSTADGTETSHSGATSGEREVETTADSKLGTPLVLGLENAEFSHMLAIQRALLTSNPLLLQQDANNGCTGSASVVASFAAHFQQQAQLFPWLTGPPTFPYLQSLMDSGVSLAGVTSTTLGGSANIDREAKVVEEKKRKADSNRESGCSV